MTGIIDVALLPTLARRGNVDGITAGYGFVIVDECHHVAAAAFSAVLDRIPARYWLGLTATPERCDGSRTSSTTSPDHTVTPWNPELPVNSPPLQRIRPRRTLQELLFAADDARLEWSCPNANSSSWRRLPGSYYRG